MKPRAGWAADPERAPKKLEVSNTATALMEESAANRRLPSLDSASALG
jgi:hypothetical protein